MPRYLVSEGSTQYKILVVSENETFVRACRKFLARENIGLVVRNQSENLGIQTTFASGGNWVAVIYDLTQTNIKLDDLKKVVKRPGIKTLFILKRRKTSADIQFFSLGENVDAVTISNLETTRVNKLSKQLVEKYFRYEKKFLGGTPSVESDKRNRHVWFICLLLIPLLPYLFTLVVLVNGFFRRNLAPRVNLSKTLRFCHVDTLLNRGINSFVRFYSSPPVLQMAYKLPQKVSDEEAFESFRYCNNVKQALTVNAFLKSLIDLKPGMLTIEKSSPNEKLFLSRISGESETGTSHTSEEILIEKMGALFGEFARILRNEKERTYLITTQDNSFLTPTGGKLKDGYLFSIKAGEIFFLNSFKVNDLEQKFKGKFDMADRVVDNENLSKIDQMVLPKDKFQILVTMIKDVYGLEIDGQISIQNSYLDGLVLARDLLAKNNLSYQNSLDLYKRLAVVVKSKGVTYFDKSLVWDVFSIFDNTAGWEKFSNNCNLSIGFLDVGKQSNTAATNVTVDSVLSDLKLSLRVLFSKPANRDNQIVTYFPAKVVTKLPDKDGVFQKEISLPTQKFFVSKALANVGSGELVDFSFPVKDCKDGFGVTFIKQPGNETLGVNYNFLTGSTYYLYINGNLTGVGNKFYNSKLLTLTEDTTLRFIKQNE